MQLCGSLPDCYDLAKSVEQFAACVRFAFGRYGKYAESAT